MKKFLLPCMLLLVAAPLPTWAQTQAAVSIPENTFQEPLRKAVGLFNKGAYAECLKALRKAGAADPAELHYLTGLAERRLGHNAEAAAELRTSLSFRGSNSDVIAELGLTQLAMGEKEEGIRSIREAIWFGKPAHHNPAALMTAVAKVYDDDGDAQKAEETYRQALTHDQYYLPARLRIAELIFLKGDKRQAIAELKLVYEREPSNADVRRQMASYLLSNADRTIDKQDIAEALSLTQAVMNGKSDAEQYADPAFPVYLRALIASGKLDDAEPKLNAALKAYPQNVELQRLQQQLPFEHQATSRESARTKKKGNGEASAPARS